MIVMKTSFILVSVYSIAVRGTVLSQADFIDLVINFGDLVKTMHHTFLRNGCLGGIRRKNQKCRIITGHCNSLLLRFLPAPFALAHDCKTHGFNLP